MAANDEAARLTHTSRSERFTMYSLIAGQHLVNLLIRFALPFIVPSMVAELGISERQRAQLLAAFTPGYILTQVPAAAVVERLGAKVVLGLNNLGLALALLALPSAARLDLGFRGLWACIAAIGVLQGPFIVAQGVMTHAWVVTGAERPLAIYIIRLGGNIAKVAAAALTPTLTAAMGWAGACRVFAVGILGWTAVWVAAARSGPPMITAGAADAAAPKAGGSAPPFTPMLLLTRPALALFVAQTSSALCEINLVSLYLPTYFHEVLGVPLGALARYTTVPMVVGIASRTVIAGAESALLAGGRLSHLHIRKLAAVAGGLSASASLVALTMCGSSPLFVMLASCGVTFGNSFASSVTHGNYLEVCAGDAKFSSCVNTACWFGAWLSADGIVRVARALGDGRRLSWPVLWLSTAVVRALSSWLYCCWASTRSAQDHLAGRVQLGGPLSG
jgi:predicted MFS family arabinose efflux permease